MIPKIGKPSSEEQSLWNERNEWKKVLYHLSWGNVLLLYTWAFKNRHLKDLFVIFDPK